LSRNWKESGLFDTAENTRISNNLGQARLGSLRRVSYKCVLGLSHVERVHPN
jgi:hypothetical protein